MVSITLPIPEETRKPILEQLEKEKDFNDWAVNIVREGRKD